VGASNGSRGGAVVATITFAELPEATETIQEAGVMEHPVALPWLVSSDIVTAYDAALGSLGTDFVDHESRRANFDSPAATQAFEELESLLPYMDPQVTTFDQPAAQQQMYNGDAAISIMFSGRMSDLTHPAKDRTPGVDTAGVSRKAEDSSGTDYQLRNRGATMADSDKDQKDIGRDFDEAVNLTARQLADWLETEESQSVGQSDGGESVGHRSGRRIVDILEKKKSERTEADFEHMHKVVGYIHRHLAQRPDGDVSETRWRYSLMNWGHDPLKN
jgi:hypothetical protein